MRHLISIGVCVLVASFGCWVVFGFGWELTAPWSYIAGATIGLAASVAFWLAEILLIAFADLE